MPWPDGTNEHEWFATMSRIAEISPLNLALAHTAEALVIHEYMWIGLASCGDARAMPYGITAHGASGFYANGIY